MRRLPWSPAAALALAALVLGCGAGAPPPPPATPAAPPGPSASGLPPGHVLRSDVDLVMPEGPPWLLRRVPVEPVLAGGGGEPSGEAETRPGGKRGAGAAKTEIRPVEHGRLLGWRVLAVPETWGRIDLRPGDLVRSVNGKPVETPDQLFEVWSSLRTVDAVRIELERDGAPRQLLLTIVGGPGRGKPPPAERPAGGVRPVQPRTIEEGGPEEEP